VLYRMGGLLLGALMLCFGAFAASEGVDDVITLQRAEVGADVLTAFVENSLVAYDLSADDIQLLEDAQVPSTVIVAMLDHKKQMQSEQPALPASPLIAAGPAPEASTVLYAPPPDQANISLFYEALTPYGAWTQDADNGWVWEPTDGVRDPNWRPYANNGHWVWTDYGWYWESDSPYGWATYHYGRWGYNSRHHWSWAPDNVWGPAWVDWRQSEDYYGWAPLPFGSRYHEGIGFSLDGVNIGFDFHTRLNEGYYSFVPSRSFLDINLSLVLEPERRRHDFYSNTRGVNNTYAYSNNRIINNGVPLATVERATRHTIDRVSVVDANIAVGQPIRGERRNANRIEAYRPKLASVAPIDPPAIAARQRAAATAGTGTTAAKQRGDNRDDLRSGKVDRIGDGNSGQGDDLHRKTATEQDAQRRLAEEKVRLKEKKANPAAEHKAAIGTPTAPKVDASFERHPAANEAARERNATTEAEKEASDKVRGAKAAADAREKATEERHPAKPEAQPRSTNKDAATELKDAAEANKAAQHNAAAAEAGKAAQRNAAAAEANKEAQHNAAAAEANKEAQHNAAAAETKQEERDSTKEDRGHGKK
jgi:hypothetical protein